MKASELAKQFCEQGLSGTWLSLKRTNFLKGLAQKDKEVRYDPEHHTYQAEYDDGQSYFEWSLNISPLNGCGAFRAQHILKSDLEEEWALETRKQEYNKKLTEILQGVLSGKLETSVASIALQELGIRYAEVVSLEKM